MTKLVGLAALWVPALCFAQTLVFDADVPDDGKAFVLVDFQVPAGTKELEIRHDDGSPDNILDWGLDDPNGYRGWGGGNTEPAIVNELAASRSYLPGPIVPGTWHVKIGKAKIVNPPGHYHIEVDLRTAPTLAAQTERTPYVPSPPLKTEARYYAGDFHVHSIQSGDAKPPIDQITTYAKSRGLDFVALSDHNTVAQLDYIVDAQSRSPDVLILPSVEFTTYAGHANGIGATKYVDFTQAAEDGGITEAVRQFHEQGALFSVNHPALDLGNLCIGCSWKQKLPRDQIDAVEIETGGYSQAGVLFLEPSIKFWETVLQTKPHTPALGGSDDHSGGVISDPGRDSPIGSPTTLIFAKELSVVGIMDGIRAGHTVVKTQGPDDPMIELSSGDAIVGDTVRGTTVRLKAVVTGGAGQQLRFVKNGTAMDPVPVPSDPFTYELDVTPSGAEDRYRAEVLVNGKPRTITSHMYVMAPEPVQEKSGCGCNQVPGAVFAAGLLALVVQMSRRKRTPPVT